MGPAVRAVRRARRYRTGHAALTTTAPAAKPGKAKGKPGKRTKPTQVAPASAASHFDAKAELPDGAKVDGVEELKRYIFAGKRKAFGRCGPEVALGGGCSPGYRVLLLGGISASAPEPEFVNRQRLAEAGEWLERPVPPAPFAKPEGKFKTSEEIRVMYDRMVAAIQTDMTRALTYRQPVEGLFSELGF